jgi:hypothetical protein
VKPEENNEGGDEEKIDTDVGETENVDGGQDSVEGEER